MTGRGSLPGGSTLPEKFSERDLYPLTPVFGGSLRTVGILSEAGTV